MLPPRQGGRAAGQGRAAKLLPTNGMNSRRLMGLIPRPGSRTNYSTVHRSKKRSLISALGVIKRHRGYIQKCPLHPQQRHKKRTNGQSKNALPGYLKTSQRLVEVTAQGLGSLA